jgi:hypothetical protein
MDKDYKLIRRDLVIMSIALISMGSFCGAGIAYSIGPKQQVIKEIHTVNKRFTVEKEVPAKSCLDGKDGIVVSAHSEHVSVDDKNGWQYGNVITFEVDGVNRICAWTSQYNMMENVKIGMRIHPYGGEPQ